MSELSKAVDRIALASPAGQARSWVRIGLYALAVILLLIAAFVAAEAIHGGLARLNPFSAENRLPAAEATSLQAQDQAGAAQLEVQGAAAQAGRVERHHQTVARAVEISNAAIQAAAAAPDANAPLDPDRSARLRDADSRLCDLRPALCADAGAAAAGGGPGDGAPELPAAPPSDRR